MADIKDDFCLQRKWGWIWEDAAFESILLTLEVGRCGCLLTLSRNISIIQEEKLHAASVEIQRQLSEGLAPVSERLIVVDLVFGGNLFIRIHGLSEQHTTADLLLAHGCASILTSDVRNNKINIRLLNILVHSRSKVEVFFWQTLPAPPFLQHLSLYFFSQMHCVSRSQSITLCLAGEKALFHGGCFLVLPALLFQRAPGRPPWWTLWSSLAGSSGTLSSPPHPPPSHLHLSLFHSPRVFTRTFLCPSSVVHSLFDNDDYCTCLNPPLQSGLAFWDQPRSVQGPLRVQAHFYCLKTNSLHGCRQQEMIVLGVLGQMFAWAGCQGARTPRGVCAPIRITFHHLCLYLR